MQNFKIKTSEKKLNTSHFIQKIFLLLLVLSSINSKKCGKKILCYTLLAQCAIHKKKTLTLI